MNGMNSIDRERSYNKTNIELGIASYLELLRGIKFPALGNNVLEYFKQLKRGKIESGPYPHVSVFEASNRILTDLTILYGVQQLLNKKLKAIGFDQYDVLLGNENHRQFDIMAENESQILIGEAFNVATSFFPGKKAASLEKMRSHKKGEKDLLILLMYNADAVSESYSPKREDGIFHLPVHVVFE